MSFGIVSFRCVHLAGRHNASTLYKGKRSQRWQENFEEKREVQRLESKV